MQLSHTRRVASAVFDNPNLVSGAGLADEHLSIPTDKGANAGLKVGSLVMGMVAGADSIDDLGLLRHGGMGKGVHPRATRPRRWARSCRSSPSATSASSTPSPPGS